MSLKVQIANQQYSISSQALSNDELLLCAKNIDTLTTKYLSLLKNGNIQDAIAYTALDTQIELYKISKLHQDEIEGLLIQIEQILDIKH